MTNWLNPETEAWSLLKLIVVYFSAAIKSWIENKRVWTITHCFVSIWEIDIDGVCSSVSVFWISSPYHSFSWRVCSNVPNVLILFSGFSNLTGGGVWSWWWGSHFGENLEKSWFEGVLRSTYCFSFWGETWRIFRLLVHNRTLRSKVTGITDHRVCGVLLAKNTFLEKDWCLGMLLLYDIIFTDLCLNHRCCIDDLCYLNLFFHSFLCMWEIPAVDPKDVPRIHVRPWDGSHVVERIIS